MREEAASDTALQLMAIIAINKRPLAAVDTAVAAASSPEEAVHGFLRAFVGEHVCDLRMFRACFLDQLRSPMEFNKEELAQLYPINDLMFGPLAAKLSAYWGNDELLHGIDPRRLAFAGYLGGLGLLVMKSLVELSDDPLKHSDEGLVTELSQALAAPTTMMTQLVALNTASRMAPVTACKVAA